MGSDHAVVEWLLEEENPSVRYRTLKEILGRDETGAEVMQAKSAIPGSEPVRQILQRMHPQGYWLHKNARTKVVHGEGVMYDAFATTHFCLAYLAELGMPRSSAELELASGRYLSLQQADGDWLNHYSCLYAYNIRTFLLLGYAGDARLQRSIDLMLQTRRADGGYLCEMHEGKYKTRFVKSCVRGSVKALLAFAELPQVWDSPRCRELLAYFLNRGGVFRNAHPERPVNQDMSRSAFPIIWRANDWEILYALSKMGYGKDERLSRAWEMLERKAGADGRYCLDWTPAQCPWKVGNCGEENKWITFYVTLARKYRDEIPTWSAGI